MSKATLSDKQFEVAVSAYLAHDPPREPTLIESTEAEAILNFLTHDQFEVVMREAHRRRREHQRQFRHLQLVAGGVE